MYADIQFYQSTYCGKLPEGELASLLVKAGCILDSITQQRLYPLNWQTDEQLTFAVSMATCALADLLHQQSTQEATGGQVVSESIGKWSRSVQASTESWESRYRKAAAQYLPQKYNLLYRGVAQC